MQELNVLRDNWLQLIRKGSYGEADELFWNRLFPLVERNFLEKNKVNTAYDWLVLPCGLEASYYILLIKALKPGRVYFLGTEEFYSNYLDKIIERTGLKPSQYITDKIDYDELDIADVYEKIRRKLDLFLGKKILMDLTRGKRIMSVGAGIVGAFFGFDLVYLDEAWADDIKRGIPGTEKIVMVRNPFDVFGDLELREARDFLNHHNYGAALALYKRIKLKILDPRSVEIEESISESYMHWNSFNFKAAYLKMKNAVSKAEQYNIKINNEILKNIKALELLNSGQKPDDGKNTTFDLHVVVDLYANAMRKSEIGLFEDAISRLYRVLELISQSRLVHYNIDTHTPEINKYSEEYKLFTKEVYGFEKELPAEIGLKDGYALLFILKDYLLEHYTFHEMQQMFGVIRARDMSIIAHGLQLAGEKVFVNMNNLARMFIQRMCVKEGKNFNELMQEHTFVKL
ncbi:MAG: TIGR02710 family CRISPR-associated CARF protein [Nanoarchaeota archaeon]